MKLFLKIAMVIILGLFLGKMVFDAQEPVPEQGQVQEQDESWAQINTRATDFYKDQKFMKAAGAARQALTVARALPETERDKIAISLGNLAMIYTHLGKFGEAEEHAKEELALRESIFGKEDMEVVKAWNHLAIIYTMAQAPDDAERCLEMIISLEERKFGKESPQVIAALQRLEKFYDISRNEKKAKQIAERLRGLKAAGE